MQYKEIENFQNKRVNPNNNKLLNIEDEIWEIQNYVYDDNQEDIPENLISYIKAQSEILADSNEENEQRIEAAINLYDNLSQYHELVQYIFFSDDTLYSIQNIIYDDNLSYPPQVISLLKLLVMKLPIVQNCINTKLVESIHRCLYQRILFSTAADLIEILAVLASSQYDEMFNQMSNCGVITTICDILSYINTQNSPSREKESVVELPFISEGINLESKLIIFPLLVFLFHFFKWRDSYLCNVYNEFLDHLVGLISYNLSDKELCCLMNILMNASKKDKLMEAIKNTGFKFQILSILFDIAFKSSSKTQIFAINTIVNLSYNDNENILVNNQFLNSIFQMLDLPELNNALEECLLSTIQNLAFNLCYYPNKYMKSVKIVELFHLNLLKDYFDKGSFSARVIIGRIFINLLERKTYRNEFFKKVDFNVLEILLPLIQIGNRDLALDIIRLLLSLILYSENKKFQISFCSEIKDDEIFDLYSDPESSDSDVYYELMQLKKIIDDVITKEK